MTAIKLAGLSPHPPIIVQAGVKRGPLPPHIEGRQRVAIARPKALTSLEHPALILSLSKDEHLERLS